MHPENNCPLDENVCLHSASKWARINCWDKSTCF